jgi:hypothetical protein
MKGMNILEAHLVGKQLLLRLSKKAKISYLQIDLKSKEKAFPITEGSYQESVKKGTVRSEFSGLIVAARYCSILNPICVFFELGPTKSYFKFTDQLDSITVDEVDILMSNEASGAY